MTFVTGLSDIRDVRRIDQPGHDQSTVIVELNQPRYPAIAVVKTLPLLNWKPPPRNRGGVAESKMPGWHGEPHDFPSDVPLVLSEPA